MSILFTCRTCRSGKSPDEFGMRGSKRSAECKQCASDRKRVSREKLAATRGREKQYPRNRRMIEVRRACLDCGVELVLAPASRKRSCDDCLAARRLDRIRRKKSGGHRRRATRFGADYETVDRLAVFERDGWVCGLCSEPVDAGLSWPDPWSASLDHIVPISLGGAHTEANLQCAHLGCNLAKGARQPVEAVTT